MIIEQIPKQVIDKIEEELIKEREKIDAEWKGKIIDYDDLENTMICDIFLDYYWIPLMEIQEIIYKELPFLKGLNIDIYPYIGDMNEEHCNVSYANWDVRVWLHLCFFDVNNWDNLLDEQKEKVNELLSNLTEFYSQFDIDMELYLVDLPEEFKDENGIVYEGCYKKIV